VVHTFLHADDTPRQIAMGAAVATFIAFLPIVGIQTVVAIALAALLRVNKAICVPIVWITNPATLVPVYSACYWLGRFVMGQGGNGEFDPEQSVLGPVTRHQGWGRFISSAFWKDLGNTLLDLSLDLWVGCALVGLVLGTVAYFVVRWAVVKYRERHRRRMLRRALLRAEAGNAKVTHRSDPDSVD